MECRLKPPRGLSCGSTSHFHADENQHPQKARLQISKQPNGARQHEIKRTQPEEWQNTLEVKTNERLRVTPKMAGMESNAKIKSVVSHIKGQGTAASGFAPIQPGREISGRRKWDGWETIFLAIRTTGFFSGCTPSLLETAF